MVAALAAVLTGHCVVAVLKAVKAGVPRFGVKLVSGVNRTVLWWMHVPCLRMDFGCLDKAVESTRLV